MRTQQEVKERLKEAKSTYEDRRKSLRIASGRVKGDHGVRKVVLNQLYQLAVEIELLEWVMGEGNA